MLDVRALYENVLDTAEKFLPVLDTVAGIVVPGLDLDRIIDAGKSVGALVDKAIDVFEDDDEKQTLQEKKDQLDLKIEAVMQHANETRKKLRGD